MAWCKALSSKKEQCMVRGFQKAPLPSQIIRALLVYELWRLGSCVYGSDATIEVLQDLIPYALVQLNQEGTTMEIEGALLASLKHCVSAVALEEDSDMFRKYMLEKVTFQ